MRKIVSLGILLFVGASAKGQPPLCTPGRSVACACPDGAVGAQVCDASGVYRDCSCRSVPLGPSFRRLVTESDRVEGIAVDGTSIYWATPGTLSKKRSDSRVMKRALAGGRPVKLADGDRALDLAVDSTNVYWTAWPDVYPSSNKVMKVPKDGGPPTTLASGGRPISIVVDRTSVYWADLESLAIVKVPIDGGRPVVLVSAALTRDQEQSYSHAQLAVDSTNVYWTDQVGGRVMKVPIGGGVPAIIAERQPNPFGIAVADGSLYWANSGRGSAEGLLSGGAVMTMDLAGGRPAVLVSGLGLPNSIAVSGLNVYWANDSLAGGSVMKVSIAGGMPFVLAPGQNSPQDIAVDGTSVYWTVCSADANFNVIVKLTPK